MPVSGDKGNGEGQDAHTAHIHQQDQQPLGEGGEGGGGPGGQAHRAHGGGHLEGAVQVGQILHRGHHHGAEHKDTQHHQRQGHGIEHPAVVDRPAAEGDLLPAHEAGAQGQQQHAHRGGLDAAGGRAGGAADEHQHAGHGLAGVAEAALADGVEAGGAQGDGLEQGVESLLPEGHVPQGGGIVKLLHQEEQGAPHDQHGGDEEHHLAVDRQPAPAPLVHNVLPHEEAQAAHHNEGGGGAQHQGVVVVAGQAAKGTEAPSQQIKARVTEGGDRVEHGVPGALEKAELRDEAHRHEHRPRRLHGEGADEGVAHHPHHPVHVVEVEGGHHDKPLRQANTPVEGEGDEGDDRHEAQAAQLDHGQDDRLTEQSPLGPRVHQDQAGDAGGGGGGEQSGEEPGALSVPGGDGQGQQQRPDQNNRREGARHDPGGVEAPAADKAVPQPERAFLDQSLGLLKGGMETILTQKSMPKEGFPSACSFSPANSSRGWEQRGYETPGQHADIHFPGASPWLSSYPLALAPASQDRPAQYSLAPAGMWSSTIRQWSFSTPSSWCTAEMIMPQESMPIILRGGRLVMAMRVLPTSSSGS